MESHATVRKCAALHPCPVLVHSGARAKVAACFFNFLKNHLMRRFNPTALQKYIDKKDRTTPLLFTGRREELAIAHAALGNLKEEQTQGNTVVFQGAPGAGKTALLEHIKDTLANECDSAKLSAPLIGQPHEALFEVLKQIEPDTAETLRKSHQITKHGDVNFGVGSGGVSSSSTSTPEDITTLHRLMDERKSNKPLVLFLDEAQNAEGDLPSGRSTILQTLHEGDAGKVCLIAGGLSDTEARLNQLGVSRLSFGNMATLQPLHEQEVIVSLEAFLNNEDFCIEVGGCDTAPLQQLVINESSGWPQHLTNTLHAIGEELIKVNGQLAECHINAIQRRSQARREDYYMRRVETIPEPLLYEVVSTIPKGGSVKEYMVYEAVERAYKSHPLINQKLPYEEAFHRLVHRGVLQEDTTGNLTVPIPSMHDYIKHRSSKATAEGLPSTAGTSALRAECS